MSLAVILGSFLLFASTYAASVAIPSPTPAVPVADKINKVLSETRGGFRVIASILTSLGNDLGTLNGPLGRVVSDLAELKKAQVGIADSVGNLVSNYTALKHRVDRLEKYQPRCPTDWTRRGEMCYKFYSDKNPFSANDAKSFCEMQGTTLASLKSAEVNEFVSSLVADHVHHYFAGARDDVVEGEWLWPDDSRANYTNWFSSEPNNDHGGKEHCLQVYRNKKNTWNDVMCDYKFGVKFAGYVCETKTRS